MKKIFKRFNSITIKVIILYASLTFLDIAFFTSIVFENQIDLITDNSKLKAEKIVSSALISLKKFYMDNKNSIIFMANDKGKILEQIDSIMKPLVNDYIIFDENGTILKKSNADLKLQDSFINDGMKAVADLDFTGREYFVKIKEKSYLMFFYIPLKKYDLNNLIMYIPYDLRNLGDSLKNLYSQVFIMFLVTSIFHIIFAILLFRIIINPIQLIRRGSIKIQAGDLNARVHLKRNDEIGQLSQSFNDMAESIQDKITTLKIKNDDINQANKMLKDAKRIADMDMGMAINVQRRFFIDKPPMTALWDTAFIFKPVSGVSGDLYDFYTQNNELIGVSLFDVSGHGIASGLITMLSKQIIFRNFKQMKNNSLPAILEAINNELIAQIENVESYLTGIILRFDENKIEYVNAGHTDLLLKSKNNVMVVGAGSENFRASFLGIATLNENYKGIRFSIKEGDSLLLFTDCLVESCNSNKDSYAMNGILNSFKACPYDLSAKEMLDYIINDFNEFTKDVKLRDDLTIILLKRK